MKHLYDFFGGATPAGIQSSLRSRGISIDLMHCRFSDINIVIGPNGSGKTRLLNAVRECYRLSADTEVLYGYFPGLPSSRPGKLEELPDISLEEYLTVKDVSFDDVFHAILSQNEDFLFGLLKHRSVTQRQSHEKSLNTVRDYFMAFTGKELMEEEGANGKVLALKENDKKRSGLLENYLDLFSPGERVLLYMSIFFSLRKTRESARRVIILDEPETHLHPKALLQFIHVLREAYPNTELWIATHNLFLLPEFQFENIVYMENGCVCNRNSTLYQKILSSMLGEDRTATQEFFASLHQWQYFEFISACFRAPVTLDKIDEKDEQVRIFYQAMTEHKIRKILDFGGGRGRLALSMQKLQVAEWDGVEYHILEQTVYEESECFKVFDDIEKADNDYDCVVMMNVLHEIDPDEWPDIFGRLYPRMKPNSCLLLVEVEALRDGEYPNETGYVLLDKPEMGLLFCEKNPNSLVLKRNQKSKAFVIPREDLPKVKTETVSRAIQKLEKRTYEEIKAIRQEGQKPSNSRRYAFLLQQHMNAKLYNDRKSVSASEESSKNAGMQPPSRFGSGQGR